ncbi:MAG: type II secretion system F family protein [Micropruina sp.]|nr:type II secretion system F family protein [Micropruina sp.]
MPAVPVIGIATLSVAISMLAWILIGTSGVHRHQMLGNLRRGLSDPANGTVIAGRRRRGLGTLAVQWMPAQTRGYLDRLLAGAGRPPAWPVERVIVVKFLLLVTGGVLALLLVNALRTPLSVGLAIFLTTLFFFIPDLRLYSQGIERRQRISLQLPDTLDQMSIAVEAGLGFDAAMIRVARNGKGELAAEMIRAMQDIQVGQPRRVAYTELGERCGVPELRRFMRSIVQAEAYGLALSDVLHTQAQEMRVQRRQRAEAKAMEIPVKVVFPLILCILPVIFIVLLGPAGIRIAEAFQGLG